jgi:site-specific DNA recombinase
MKNINKIALIYTRVSSSGQETDGTGNKSQEVRCREFAKENHWEVESVFTDTFTGGGDFMERPAMKKLLDHLEINKIKEYIVIFDDLKRFARDTEFHIRLRTTFKKYKVQLSCLNFKFEDTPEGKFVETIFAAQNQLEREQNQRQVIQKQRARMIDGYWPHRAFKGYAQIKTEGHGKLSFPNEKAIYITESFEGYAFGRFKNLLDVGTFLSENKVINGGSDKMLGTTALSILKNIFYAGYIECSKYEVSRRVGKHKPIINLDIFSKVQEKIESRFKFEREYQIVRDEFELRGIARCEGCLTKFRSYITRKNRSKKIVEYHYYECKVKTCKNYAQTITAKTMHEDLYSLLKQISPSTEVLEIGKKAYEEAFEEFNQTLKVDDKFNNEKLINLNKQIDNLLDSITGTSSQTLKKTYEEKLETLIYRKDLITSKEVNVPDMEKICRTSMERVFNIIKSPYESWIKMDSLQKKIFYSYIFQEDFTRSKENKCRTLKLSPIYQYLQDISNFQEREKEESSVLWRLLMSLRTNYMKNCRN